MTGADIKAALEFHRRTPQDRLREYHFEGLCRLDAIPDDAVLVTQESLARALHEAMRHGLHGDRRHPRPPQRPSPSFSTAARGGGIRYDMGLAAAILAAIEKERRP